MNLVLFCSSRAVRSANCFSWPMLLLVLVVGLLAEAQGSTPLILNGECGDAAVLLQHSVKHEESSLTASTIISSTSGVLTESAIMGKVSSFFLDMRKMWGPGAGPAEDPVWGSPPQVAPGLDAWDTFDTIMVLSMIIVLALFDIFVQSRLAYSIHNHAVALLFMLIASGVFCFVVWQIRGQTDGVAWLTGYVVEWALSMDNLFVFTLIFKAFSVPSDQAIRALSIGIYGAIIFRLVFILCLSELLKLHYAVDVVLGGVLITSGLLSLNDSDEEDVHDLSAVRFFKWLFGSRLQETYDEEGRLFTRSATGELQMTLLFLVVCVIAVVDCIFAVDSVGSKTGQIKSLYINVTSCLMAMFSLRSLFFLIKDLADYFEYVKYGICAILCFVGTEMIVSKWFEIPLPAMCIIIALLFVGSVVCSVIKVHSSHSGEQDTRAKLASEDTAVNVKSDGGAEDTDARH